MIAAKKVIRKPKVRNTKMQAVKKPDKKHKNLPKDLLTRNQQLKYLYGVKISIL